MTASAVPRVAPVEGARKMPELAVLAAMTHGNDGAVCLTRRCAKLPGTACGGNNECTGDCGNGVRICGGRCTVAAAPGAERTNGDGCLNLCTSGRCTFIPEGGSCATDEECENGACQGGACHCLPAGAMALTGRYDGCCMSWVIL